jgi:DNA sulfur modification protein DndD
MFINSIEVSNFRRYLGVNRLSFCPSPGKNIAIVSGTNGSGKTSILLAVLWCLYGARLQWLDDGYSRLIRATGDYESFCRGLVNRQARQSGHEDMYVELNFADVMLAGVAVSCVGLRRSFDASQGLETVRLVMGPSGAQMVSAEAADAFIENSLIPLDIASYLLFDAERVAAGEGVWGTDPKQLGDALSSTAGLRPYVLLRDDLRAVRLRLRRQSAKRTQRAALDAIEKRKVQAQSELAGLAESVALARDERVQVVQELDRLRQEAARLGNVPSREGLASLERKKQAIEKDREEIRGGLRAVLEVAPLAIAGGILKGLEGDLLAETRRTVSLTTREIARLAASAVADVKGSSVPALSDAAANELSASLARVLESHFSGARPSQTTKNNVALKDLTGEEKALIRDVLSCFHEGFRSRLAMSLRAFRLNEREYARITRAIAEASRLASNPDIATFQQQMALLEARGKDLDSQLQRLNREYGGMLSRIEDMDKQSVVLVDSITVSERHQKADAIASQLIDELDEFISNTHSEAAEELSHRLEHVFRTLLHKKGLVAGTRVATENNRVSIVLTDGTGQAVAPETLSKGEQQVCSMAVLMALLGMAPEPFPLFLDSPFQRLDEQHTSNLISGLAALSECQVVLLPLPGTELSSDVRRRLSVLTSDMYFIQDQGEWSTIENADLATKVAHESCQ